MEKEENFLTARCDFGLQQGAILSTGDGWQWQKTVWVSQVGVGNAAGI